MALFICNLVIYRILYVTIIAQPMFADNNTFITIESKPNIIKTSNHLLHTRYKHIIDNVTSHSNVSTVKDINGDLVVYNHDNGIIYGNPLLLPQCRNALHSDLPRNSDLNNFINENEWILTQERLSRAILDDHTPTFLMDQAKIHHTLRNTNETINNATYVNIEKSASSVMSEVAKRMNMTQQAVTPGDYVQTLCGFTFVRNPISRFVSGYYSVHGWVLDYGNPNPAAEQVKQLRFWNITTEP
eukprot:788896_1